MMATVLLGAGLGTYGAVATLVFTRSSTELRGRGRSAPAAAAIALPTAALWPVAVAAVFLASRIVGKRRPARPATLVAPALTRRA